VPPEFPEWPPPDDVLPTADRTVDFDLATSERGSGALGAGEGGTVQGDLDASVGRGRLGEDFSAKQVRPRRVQPTGSWRDRLWSHFDGRCGFGVAGAEVNQVWAPVSVYVESGNLPRSWRFHSGSGHSLNVPAPVLLEFKGGQFAALVALPDFVGTIQ